MPLLPEQVILGVAIHSLVRFALETHLTECGEVKHLSSLISQQGSCKAMLRLGSITSNRNVNNFIIVNAPQLVEIDRSTKVERLGETRKGRRERIEKASR